MKICDVWGRTKKRFCANLGQRNSLKINFIMWRVWRRRIAIDDNLKRMKINIVCQYKRNAFTTTNYCRVEARMGMELARDSGKTQ
ncbi:hypothetical protein H5410_030847 [Solanum commersonii]|uniref:Uncharacterized protein n=1 Tax=Solanum commersonii TaxID=4109 RepID=A0A9J5YHE0_SOLCO|nr:hypothetical protein H5410_030847 [Solanum commersonii]